MDSAAKGESRRIHRHRSRRVGPAAAVCPHLCSTSAVELTVWCRSLLFNGHGYTVYDSADGRMIFRVDNYAHKWREEVLLMDSTGGVLLTVRRRRKMLGIKDNWEVYEGEIDVSSTPARRQSPLFRVTKALGNPSYTISPWGKSTAPAYRMNWSPREEWCQIFAGAAVAPPRAEITRKCGGVARGELLGRDVLAVKIQPEMDQALVMALLMINDAMR
ncbi:unnamed protein product [Spirodela intermedia]|uniref:Uncharacterized protein n=1 Tax=Spirodela intermedia TaxID=51605 RepID=A0A7I8JY29_SPIIN|nr:unnamed protein product [Spirodela intermedia]